VALSDASFEQLSLLLNEAIKQANDCADFLTASLIMHAIPLFFRMNGDHQEFLDVRAKDN
jgi:dephospho-CoA kinase